MMRILASVLWFHRLLVRSMAGVALSYAILWWVQMLVARVGIMSVERATLQQQLGVALLCWCYWQMFEFCWHRIARHEKIEGLVWALKSHMKHHAVFHRLHFQTRNEDDLKEILGAWYVFPMLFAINYMLHVGLWLRFLPSSCTLIFFAGLAIQFAIFEWCHWFTHLENNLFDRIVARIPYLSRIRRDQIEMHRAHHETPRAQTNFNFTWPYLGDRVAGTLDIPSTAT